METEVPTCFPGSSMSSFPEVSAGMRALPQFQSLLFPPGCCSVLLEQGAVGVGEGLRALRSPVHLMVPWVRQVRWVDRDTSAGN